MTITAANTPSFVEALHRDEIKKLARETSNGGAFVLDELPEEKDDVIINPDYFYEG